MRTNPNPEAVIAFARAAGCLIVILLTACDNVSWGGIDVTIVPPPPRPRGQPAPGVEPGAERLPQGPVLYHVSASGSVGSMVPVGEIDGDSLLPLRPTADPRAYGENFIAEHMRQGSEFVLFREGVRAGTFLVSSAALDSSACGPVPEATGSLELGEAGAGVEEFLALERAQAPQIPRRAARPLEVTRTMRVIAPIDATQLLRNHHAQFPANWDRAMAQLMAIGLSNARDPGFAATFLVGDTLGPGLDDSGHSLFFVAMPSQLGYDTVYVSFQNYAETGKAAPQVVDFLDWDRDDWPELLLRVYGSRATWYEAVGRDADGHWRRIFSDRCAMEPADNAPATADSIGGSPPDTSGTR